MQVDVSDGRLVGEDDITQPLVEETSSEERLEFKLEVDKLFVYNSLFDELIAEEMEFDSILTGVLELTLSTHTGWVTTVPAIGINNGELIDVEVDLVEVFLGRTLKLKSPDT